MCMPAVAPYMMVASAGASAVGAGRSARAQRNALDYQAEVSANNAQIAEWQAQDAIRQGQAAEQRSRLDYAGLKGRQRAALAANGVALDEGSAVDILSSTDYLNEVDADTIRANAARSAWGYRTQAQSYLDDAQQRRSAAGAISSGAAIGTSLLGNAGQVANSWYRASQTGMFDTSNFVQAGPAGSSWPGLRIS